ncbi:chromosomal replication initiator DnaA [Aliishimia ponticola]|uniref:Chromosomal replication initiator DnaA n=1 Tax=Aliishimia ponticola TaxID=2499833 RepID=A0A4S4N9E6_9RHOB|nr:DnaA/Hda family protein [Aliishimia ponticola]THH35789.1 chromosomal replication initiator DnaA [Aliishimia ponticola]
MPQQLGLDLPGITALGRDDFLVAPSNALAVALLDAWPNWQGGKLLLSGPAGSGKTHLAHAWAARSGARIIQASAVAEDDIPALAEGPVAVEDVTDIAGDLARETALFHLHNLVLANGHSLMFTGDVVPAGWPLSLPDLKSRLQGATSAELAAPDDTLLSAVIAKLFADRQIMPPPNVIQYLVSRIDRSFDAARDTVARIDAESIARKKPVTRRLAADILDNTL